MATTITTKRGDNLRVVFAFMEDGAEANLSGCAARMQIRERGGESLLDVSTDDYLSVDGTAGTVTADVPASSMDLPTGKHDADVELTYADGTVRSSDTFAIKIIQDITRD